MVVAGKVSSCPRVTGVRNQGPPAHLSLSRSSAGSSAPLSITLTPAACTVSGTSKHTRTTASPVRSHAAFQAGDQSGKRQLCWASAESETHATDPLIGPTCVVGIGPTASQPVRATITAPRVSAALVPNTQSTVRIATVTNSTKKKAWAAHCDQGGEESASTAAATNGGPALRTNTSGQPLTLFIINYQQSPRPTRLPEVEVGVEVTIAAECYHTRRQQQQQAQNDNDC